MTAQAPDPDDKGRLMLDQEKPLLTTAPLADMVELPEGVCLYCNLPGMNPDDISVIVDGNFLCIRAESRLPPLKGKVHALEFCDILYEAKYVLPAVDKDRIEASLVDGVLRVFMPFPSETKPFRIPVREG